VPPTVCTQRWPALRTAGQAWATRRQLLTEAQAALLGCCLNYGALCAGASSAQEAAGARQQQQQQQPQQQQQLAAGCGGATDMIKPGAAAAAGEHSKLELCVMVQDRSVLRCLLVEREDSRRTCLPGLQDEPQEKQQLAARAAEGRSGSRRATITGASSATASAAVPAMTAKGASRACRWTACLQLTSSS
jgi:hypothetical protein